MAVSRAATTAAVFVARVVTEAASEARTRLVRWVVVVASVVAAVDVVAAAVYVDIIAGCSGQ